MSKIIRTQPTGWVSKYESATQRQAHILAYWREHARRAYAMEQYYYPKDKR